MPSTSFDLSQGAYSGYFTEDVAVKLYRQFGGLNSRVDLRVTGSQLVLSCLSSFSGTADVLVDGGSGATATATIVGGVVTGLVLVTGGSGYGWNGATVAITDPFGWGGGSGATATATVIGGVVTALFLNSGGSGYLGANVTIAPAWTSLTFGALGAWTTATINLVTDAAHSVSIRGNSSFVVSFYLDRTPGAAFTVTGSEPACVPDPAHAGTQTLLQPLPVGISESTGREVVSGKVRLETWYAAYPGQLNGYPLVQPVVTTYMPSGTIDDTTPYGAGVYLNTTGWTDLFVWTYCDGIASFCLSVDGVQGPVVTTPGLNAWDWVKVGSSLDGGTHHWLVTNCMYSAVNYNAGSGCIHSVKTSATAGVSVGARPARRPRLFGFAHSFGVPVFPTSQRSPDATKHWCWRAALSLGYEPVMRGIAGCTVKVNTGSGHDFDTTYAGVNRTSEVTSNAVSGDAVATWLGINDYNPAQGNEGADAGVNFGPADRTMFSAFAGVAGLRLFAFGTTPYPSFTTPASYDTQIAADVAASGGTYVDPMGGPHALRVPTDFGDASAFPGDNDGHPNDGGHAKAALSLLAAMSPSIGLAFPVVGNGFVGGGFIRGYQ